VEEFKRMTRSIVLTNHKGGMGKPTSATTIASVTEHLLEGNPQQFEDNSLRVERILLEMVRPDPVQPRRVLPGQLHLAFHGSRLTPTQALKELVHLVQVAARQRGRPFNNVLELLPNPDDEDSDDQDAKLSPEEQLLRDLVNLALTIRDDGQVNPLTVVDASAGVTRQFRIETGERRYWATWLLRDFIPGYDGDGMIPCIVIPAERSSVFRQAKENTARSGLSAIAMARQAALLLLHVHGYPMPEGPVTADFYRQALELDLRGKREYTGVILSAMGGLDRKRFSRYKALLRLSDEAMELADRHDIEEGLLRHILQLVPEEQVEVIRHVLTMKLTAKQVGDLCSKGTVELPDVPQFDVPRHTKQLVKLMKSVRSSSPDALAKVLLEQEQDVAVARARLRSLRDLVDETEQLLG
jgi:hypothetical protein